MKLNLKREQLALVTSGRFPDTMTNIARDWLTLDTECTKRGELIEQLEDAIIDHLGKWAAVSELYCPEEYGGLKSALSAVATWRKEQIK